MKRRFREPYIRYSNCFEDADTLLYAAAGKTGNALSIASAGDNSLALLTTDISKLYVFDINPAQLYLTKLKFTAIGELEYEEVLTLLGVLEGDIKGVYKKLEPYLDSETKKYFSDNQKLIYKTKLIHAGRFEHYFQIFRKIILPISQSKKNVNTFMNMDKIEEQRPFYMKKINNRRWQFVIKRFFSEKTLARIGRDKDCFKYTNGGLSKMIIDRFLLCIDHVLNKQNPYLQYAVNNRFTCLPAYLKKENFNKIKSNVHKAVFILGDLNTVAAAKIKFDFFNLSDIFEYMSKQQASENEYLVADMANDGAVAVFWNMMVDRQFESNDFCAIDTSDIHKREKAYFYQALRIYTFSKNDMGEVL